MFNPVWPWFVAAAMALWFAFIARRFGKDWRLWGLGGLVLGLVISTIAAGLGHGVTLPYSDWKRAEFQWRAFACAAGVLGLIGAALMVAQHRGSERPNRIDSPP